MSPFEACVCLLGELKNETAGIYINIACESHTYQMKVCVKHAITISILKGKVNFYGKINP